MSFNTKRSFSEIYDDYQRHHGRRERMPGEQLLQQLGIDFVEAMAPVTSNLRGLAQLIDTLDRDQFKIWCKFVDNFSGDYRGILIEATKLSGRDPILKRTVIKRK